MFDPGGVAVRPAGMVTLPALMKAGVALGLVSVKVIVLLAPGAMVVGAKETVIDTVGAAVTVNVAVLVLVLLPCEVTRLPGMTVTGNEPAIALCACTVTVQVPIAGMLPAMPRSMVLPLMNAPRLQLSVSEVMARPGTLTWLPSTIVAVDAPGLVIVTVSVALELGETLPGENATVIVGLVAATVKAKLAVAGAFGVSPE